MAPEIMVFVGICVFGTLLLHVLLSIPFKIDADTTIIVSTSAICSPPFVPVIAGALKNKEIVFSGVTTGIIGYAIGNYLGITLAYLYHAFFSVRYPHAPVRYRPPRVEAVRKNLNKRRGRLPSGETASFI